MEFIVDTISGDFYFMEMNTRLQVCIMIPVHVLENVPKSLHVAVSGHVTGNFITLLPAISSHMTGVQCLTLLNSTVGSSFPSYLFGT